MLFDTIVFQSAGSLSVAVVALIMFLMQVLFFLKNRQFTWYAWSAAISFASLLYSVSIFIEYNTPLGSLNRFSGLMEFTAIILLIQSIFGFTCSYLEVTCKRYHLIAGIIHGVILLILWGTNLIVSNNFITRDLFGLKTSYTEPALGILGPVFVFYAMAESLLAMIIWIKHKETDNKFKSVFLAGMGIWLLLGFHDGLVALGISRFQYIMEYGFLVFSIIVLWVVFNSFLEVSLDKKYQKEIQKKLGMAYTRMKEWKDRLSIQMRDEEAGFLIKKDGSIVGITEKTITLTNMNSIELLGSNIDKLIPAEYDYILRDAMSSAWAGVFTQISIMIKGKNKKADIIEARFVKINEKSQKLIMILIREPGINPEL